MMASEQLESPWPVHGTVLVDQTLSGGRPLAYFAAGRSSHIDGGIHLYALDARTGKMVRKAVVSMTAKDGAGVIKQRVLPDVLSVQRGSLFMRQLRLSGTFSPQGENVAHLYAPGGFLDDTWWHRTYWVYGTHMQSAYGGWPRVGNVVPSGRLLAIDGGQSIYGYGRMAYRAGAGHVRPDATKDYKLFAEVLSPKPKPGAKAQPARKRRRAPTGRRRFTWSTPLPFVAKSLVLTQDALLLAGGKSLTETAARHGAGTFWIAARKDGARLAQCALPAPAILDGMAVTASGVFVSTVNGGVTCVRGGR